MDAFEALTPISDGYAALPVAQAFDWSAIGEQLGAGEWYLVAFRSTRRKDADAARLTAYDDWAHDEAQHAPGFIHYFKGPLCVDGTCLSFCLWASRSDAREAAGRPRHAEAAALVGQMYERYTLEFLRVTRAEGGPLNFDPYDPVPAVA